MELLMKLTILKHLFRVPETVYFLAVENEGQWAIGDIPMTSVGANQAAERFSKQEGLKTAVVEQITRRVRVYTP